MPKVEPVGGIFGGYFDLYKGYFGGGTYYFGMILYIDSDIAFQSKKINITSSYTNITILLFKYIVNKFRMENEPLNFTKDHLCPNLDGPFVL